MTYTRQNSFEEQQEASYQAERITTLRTILHYARCY